DLAAVDFDPVNNLVVALQRYGSKSAKIVFLDPDGNQLGSLSPAADTWLNAKDLAIDPLNRQIYMVAACNSMRESGVVRVAYPDDLHQDRVDVRECQTIVTGRFITDIAVDA